MRTFTLGTLSAVGVTGTFGGSVDSEAYDGKHTYQIKTEG